MSTSGKDRVGYASRIGIQNRRTLAESNRHHCDADRRLLLSEVRLRQPVDWPRGPRVNWTFGRHGRCVLERAGAPPRIRYFSLLAEGHRNPRLVSLLAGWLATLTLDPDT